ncbi:hypothetical protein HSB1_23880 [Halogranum salarium B-1]|uniref:Uncharacterized protein n=1 Tax=Halogranum salarium B-1 TaxID=1210908 RepID=J3EW07_9EURY|nr:hypothetical protein HSB1_23880 [Halogranum salarium B-1]
MATTEPQSEASHTSRGFEVEGSKSRVRSRGFEVEGSSIISGRRITWPSATRSTITSEKPRRRSTSRWSVSREYRRNKDEGYDANLGLETDLSAEEPLADFVVTE